MFPETDPKITQTTPEKSADRLFAILVHPGNMNAAAELASSITGISVEIAKEVADGDVDFLHFTSDAKVALIGIGEDDNRNEFLEAARDAVNSAVGMCNEHKLKSLVLASPASDIEGLHKAMSEAARLSNHQYLDFKSKKVPNSLESVEIVADAKYSDEIEAGRLNAIATCIARDLVNEPVITLTAEALAEKAVGYGERFGYSTEVFNKAKIQSLKMGGLLSVNIGSLDPPTFSILEWKPENVINKNPIVLVGKGVVYDTGGLSLKDTANSMDFMKSDMGGAAAVIGALVGASARNMPIHVIGLIPATDNRPGGRAYAPGDVITMYDGTTVEVMNTDAEGRLILADALSYAKKYSPELVIDLATLTGAAVVAVGNQGIAMMSTAAEDVKSRMSESGYQVHERLVELPLWKEYRDQLKSDLADMKNVGGRPAGTITAGKFLEHFTDYPWVHLDIAGTAYISSASSYRGKNGTGSGVRLLLQYLENRIAAG